MHSSAARHASSDPRTICRSLFPLDRTRRLTCNIINNPIDPLDLIDNSTGNFFQYIIWNTGPVAGHAVHRGDRSYANGVDIGALVAHDADAAGVSGILCFVSDAGEVDYVHGISQVNRLRYSDGTGYDVKLVLP